MTHFNADLCEKNEKIPVIIQKGIDFLLIICYTL